MYYDLFGHSEDFWTKNWTASSCSPVCAVDCDAYGQWYFLPHKHYISVHLNYSLNRPASRLSCLFLVVVKTRPCGENSGCICRITLLSFQVGYNLSYPTRQKPGRQNLCPFPTIRTFLRHKLLWKNLHNSSNVRIFATSRIKKPRNSEFLFSNRTLASWTSHYLFFT